MPLTLPAAYIFVKLAYFSIQANMMGGAMRA